MNEEPTPACPWLASYEQALLGLERNGREKEKLPLDPLKRKREGKENRRDVLVSVFRAGAGAHVRAAIDADLDRAVRAFGGTPADRKLWARIAWRVGAENFHHALVDKLKEDETDTTVLVNRAAAFQAFLNDRFPKDSSSTSLPRGLPSVSTAIAQSATAVARSAKESSFAEATEDRGGAA